jgi:hypothetical protein
MWPRGLLLAEPPPGDEAATEMRKAEVGEGDRRREVGQSIY